MAYRAHNTATGTTTSVSVTKPTGTAADDILIYAICDDGASVNSTTWPTGFTQFFAEFNSPDNSTLLCAWKRAGGSEGASYDVTLNVAPGEWCATVVAFSGRNTTDPPVVGTRGTNQNEVNPVNMVAPAVTAVDADDIMYLSTFDVESAGIGNGVAVPTGMTERVDLENAGGWAYLYAATQDAVAAGTTGTKDAVGTLTSGQSGHIAALIRIPAAAGGGDPEIALIRGGKLVGGGLLLKGGLRG